MVLDQAPSKVYKSKETEVSLDGGVEGEFHFVSSGITDEFICSYFLMLSV